MHLPLDSEKSPTVLLFPSDALENACSASAYPSHTRRAHVYFRLHKHETMVVERSALGRSHQLLMTGFGWVVKQPFLDSVGKVWLGNKAAILPASRFLGWVIKQPLCLFHGLSAEWLGNKAAILPVSQIPKRNGPIHMAMSSGFGSLRTVIGASASQELGTPGEKFCTMQGREVCVLPVHECLWRDWLCIIFAIAPEGDSGIPDPELHHEVL